MWHPGEKDPYFIATPSLVKQKALMGQALVAGHPYERAALDAEALARIQSWGYPGSYGEVAAAVQDVNTEWWTTNYPDDPAIWTSWGMTTPEGWLGQLGIVRIWPPSAFDAILPRAPDDISVPVISSYP